MIRIALVSLCVCSLFGTSAFAQDDLLARARQQFEPIPTAPPELPGNVATPAKVELGKMLYFDPRLSASHTISCSSCHNIGLGGADAEPTSIGHRWQHGGRNAPTVLNSVFNKAQFWDGRAKDLEQQAGGPMVNPVEMASPESPRYRAAEGDPRLCRPVCQSVSGRLRSHHTGECAEGDRSIRGDPDHAQRAVRPISER